MTTSSSDAILTELRKGPRTTGALMEATGLSRDAVSSAIRRLNAGRHEIINARSTGSHHHGLYVLTYDPATNRRRCRAANCGTILSISNATPYCRVHLPGVALEALIRMLEEEVSEDDQLVLSVALQ